MTNAELAATGQEIAGRCWRAKTVTLTAGEAATWVDEDIERLLEELPGRKRARARDVIFLAFCEEYRRLGGTIEGVPVATPKRVPHEGWGPLLPYFMVHRQRDAEGEAIVLLAFRGRRSPYGPYIGFLDANGQAGIFNAEETFDSPSAAQEAYRLAVQKDIDAAEALLERRIREMNHAFSRGNAPPCLMMTQKLPETDSP